jgi:hypothetical protein
LCLFRSEHHPVSAMASCQYGVTLATGLSFYWQL